jgi:hypothetical protein
LIERLKMPSFLALPARHQQNIAQMLWDYASSRYRHFDGGAAFSVIYMEKLWGNRRIRNRIVKEFFSADQGGNINHKFSSYWPYEDIGSVLIEYLEDRKVVDLLADGKKMSLPRSVILSRADSGKHSAWKGVAPSRVMPVSEVALSGFYQKSTDGRERLSALRLLRLSRNSLCPGSIPVLYQQKSTGRLTEVLYALQNTEREVLSAALTGFWDYDLQNAHYSILSGWAKRLGRTTPVVDEYLRNKKEIRSELAKHCNADVGDIKECLIAILYGATLSANPDYATIPRVLGIPATKLFIAHPFIRDLRNEVQTIAQPIVDSLPRHRGQVGNAMGVFVAYPDNPLMRYLCHALQGVEALALRTVVEHCGDQILLCMHDGWVARNRLNCQELETLIERQTGFCLGIEEQQLPKYLPKADGVPSWGFVSRYSGPTGSLVLSTAPQWNAAKGTTGTWNRSDLPRPRA